MIYVQVTIFCIHALTKQDAINFNTLGIVGDHYAMLWSTSACSLYSRLAKKPQAVIEEASWELWKNSVR